MKYFDLHCDTAYEILKQNHPLLSNTLDVSLDRISDLENYAQIMAIWSDKVLSDEEAYLNFRLILENLLKEVQKNYLKAEIVRSASDFKKCLKKGKAPLFISVEDARLLSKKAERLDELYNKGVRFLTLTWEDESIIGGAYNKETGLTDFGKEVVKRCFSLGIVPDISHASFKTAEDVFSLAQKYEKPIIATHSDSFSVYPHKRNLLDCQFEFIKQCKGMVGVSFCRYHLLNDKLGTCGISDIIKHIDKYLSLGGENVVCIGADMDGAPLPNEIEGIESIDKLGNELLKLYPASLVDKIMWENAVNFIENNL